MDAQQRLDLVVAALDERKAGDVVVLDVAEVSILADYFVIASGASRIQVQAIADGVQEKAGPGRVEGYREGRWVCLDLGDVVVHVFDHAVREYFDLERLWGDASRVDVGWRAAL